MQIYLKIWLLHNPIEKNEEVGGTVRFGRLLTVSYFLIIILLTGCKPKTTYSPETVNPVTFDTLTVNETYYLLGDTTNPCCLLEAVFIYPSGYSDQKILYKLQCQFINDFFGDETASVTPQEAMNNYVAKYLTDYKELEADFISETESTGEKPSKESWYAYYEMSSNEIVYNQYNLLSYITSVEYYTGGAHGGHGFNNHVIFIENGEALDESDIFIKGFQDELAQIMVDIIAADNNVTEREELEYLGFFNINEIYPNNNFYVDNEGVTYTFNEYEIAAYSIGSVDVFIPYDTIRHLLLENSPVSPLVLRKNEPSDH